MWIFEENIKSIFYLSEYEMNGHLSIEVNISIKEIGFWGKVLVFILLKQILFHFQGAYFRFRIYWNISSM